MKKTLLIMLLLLFSVSAAFSQMPCTNEDAYQTPGVWIRQKADNFARADRSFPKAQYPLALLKAQRVVELLKTASPQFKGVQAYAYRSIGGDSDVPNGALKFQVDGVYDSYICVGNNTGKQEDRGKILLNGVTFWITVRFNSFAHVLRRVEIGGNAFVTPEGNEIFELPAQLGEFRSMKLLQPATQESGKHEAVMIGPDNRSPFKPVTREQFLRARIKYYQAQGNFFDKEIAAINSAITGMSQDERQSQAIGTELTASPGKDKLFKTEAAGGRRLVTLNKSFFNAALPRQAIQFITVTWSWDDKHPAQSRAIEEFKQNFDFNALKQMLGK